MNVDLRMLIRRLNNVTLQAIEAGAGRCLNQSHYEVEIAHVLPGLLYGNSDCDLILRHYEVDRARLQNDLDGMLNRLRAGNSRTPALSSDLVRVLVDAWIVCSLNFDEAEIRSGHFLLAAVRDRRAIEKLSVGFLRVAADDLLRNFRSIVATSAETKAAWTARPGETRGSGPGVFICYRREDTAAFADALYDRLVAAIEGVQVFRDSDSMLPGMKFTAKINDSLLASDVVLVLIGKKWLAAGSDGARRIDAQQDWVRAEIAIALENNKHVVPCLVGGARMPSHAELPDDIASLTTHNAVHLSQRSLRRDTEPLLALIQSFRSREPPLGPDVA